MVFEGVSEENDADVDADANVDLILHENDCVDDC